MRAAFIAVLSAGALLAASSSALPAPAKKHTVIIDGSRYEPASLTVKRGDSVRWVNKDPFPHTATSTGHFDSRDIGAGKSWTYVAKKAGEFSYICTLHPNMKGTLKVE
jgi:plastocyanin